MSRFKICAVVSTACLVTACGGGSNDVVPPNPSPVTAEACFDVATFQTQTPIFQKIGNRSVTWTAGDNSASFNGVPNLLEIRGAWIDDRFPGSVYKTESNYLSPIVGPELTQFGSYVTSGSGFLLTHMTTSYDTPFTDKRFTLRQGETLQYQNTGTIRKESIYGADAPLTVTNFSNTGSVTFEGMESITIGTRSVSACKFTDGANTEWYYRSLKIQLSEPTGLQSFSTLELTRDGQPY